MIKGKRKKFNGLLVSLVVVLLCGAALAGMALAAELVPVEVVAGADDAVIVVEQERTVNFTVKLSAKGQLCNEIIQTNPSTAKIHTSYSVTGSIASSSEFSTPYVFWAMGSGGSNSPITWTGQYNPYLVPAKVKAEANAVPGDYKVCIRAETTNPTLPEGTLPGHTLRNETADFLTIRVVAATPSDTTAPEGSITINSDAPYTNSTDVTLNLAAADAVGVTGYRVTDGTDASGAAIVPVAVTTSFSANIPWALTTGDDTKTVAVQYRDAAGNWSPNYTDSIVLDQTPPTMEWGAVTPAPNAAGWNKTEVTISYTTADNLSGVASSVPTNPLAFDAEEENQTRQVIVTDNAGNSATFTSPAVNIDWTPPVVTITAPAGGAEYLLNQTVPADWTAVDAISGIASASGTVPSGEAIDTNTAGTKTFTVTATDNAGNTATQSVTYYVRYAYSGILQPINADGTSIFKLGSTVPVKFQLRDAGGNSVTNAVAKIFVAKISNNVTGIESEAVSTSATTTGNLFRYDSASEQYIFNLATKPLSAGTWQIRIVLDDGTSKYVNISLR